MFNVRDSRRFQYSEKIRYNCVSHLFFDRMQSRFTKLCIFTWIPRLLFLEDANRMNALENRWCEWREQNVNSVNELSLHELRKWNHIIPWVSWRRKKTFFCFLKQFIDPKIRSNQKFQWVSLCCVFAINKRKWNYIFHDISFLFHVFIIAKYEKSPRKKELLRIVVFSLSCNKAFYNNIWSMKH